MNIFVYSDESGVFDKKDNSYENNFFVFSGLIFLSKDSKDISARKFINAERTIRKSLGESKDTELKACYLSPKHRSSLFRATNNCYRFVVFVNKSKITKEIFESKKSRQRYLDYAFKIGLKNAFIKLIDYNIINPNDIENIYVTVDEHTTATNGLYELREGLEAEFKIGTINYHYNKFHKPIFPHMNSLELKYGNSKNITLLRAADIIANRMFFYIRKRKEIPGKKNMFIKFLP